MAEKNPPSPDKPITPAERAGSTAQETSRVPKISAHARIVILVILLIIVGSGALYFYAQNKGDSGPYTQTYNSLSTAIVAGGGEGQAIIFKKISQLNSIGDTSDQYSQSYVQLTQSEQDKKAYIAINRLNVKVQDFPSPAPPQAQIEKLKTILAGDPNSANYKLYIADIKAFGQSAFPEKTINVSLAKANPFTNPSISSNAWQFDLTATDSTNQTPTHLGKVLYMIGKNSTYYFLTAAAENNWQNNTKTFQETLDSIKINQ